jgi:YVTN family beta-propeller protein
MAAAIATDSLIAGYRIGGIVGSGGMGIVYRARQCSLDRDVALKVMADGLVDDEHFRARFVHESRIAATLEHPHVLPVHEAGEHDGGLFIAMQLVPDGDLGRLIACRPRLDPCVAVAIVAQIAEALDAAHARGLVHLDVKPANVLMVERANGWHTYLTDFGLSGNDGSRAALTAIGTPLGTPHYVAPEQIRGGDTDARTDVYSLGCLLVKALTGEVPFQREGDIAVMWAHMRDQPPRVSTTPGVPKALDDVVRCALAKDPAERPQSAGDLAMEATAAMEDRPRVARRKAPTSSLSPLGARTARTPWVRFAVAVSLIALLGIGAWLRASAGHHRRAQPLGAAGVPVGAPIRVGHQPAALSVGRSGVWVANTGDDTVSLIDPHTDSVNRRPIRVGREPAGIAVDRGSVWVANQASGTVTRIDERSHRIIGGPIHVPERPYQLIAGGRYVWVATDDPSQLWAIEAVSGRRVTLPVRIGSGLEGGLAADGRTVWVGQYLQRSVRRIDVRTRLAVGAPLPVGGQPNDIVVARGAAWVALRGVGVVRIDPASHRRVWAAVPGGAFRLAHASRSVWSLGTSGTLSRFDAGSGHGLGRSIAVGPGSSDVAIGQGSVWVANRDKNAVVRVVPTALGAAR